MIDNSIPKDKTIRRIHELKEQYGWSSYRLAQRSGIPLATLQSMEKRGTPPTIPVLEDLVIKGFGITFSEFFSDGEACYLSGKEKHILEKYRKLEPEKREVINSLIDVM